MTVMLNGNKQYSLPKAVYFQCLWVVKDMDRLERIREGSKIMNHICEDEIILFADERHSLLTDDVVREARWKLDCINDAIAEIPEEYREGVILNIKYMQELGDAAHSNTWKHWKQRFIFCLAKNLRLY